MRTSNIKFFSIWGLFNTNNVDIPFNEDIKILIGENGLGKTQVLNIFYYTLTRNFLKLKDFAFYKIRLEFENNTHIEIYKSEIEALFEEAYSHPYLKDIVNEIGYTQFEILRSELVHSKYPKSRLLEHPILRKLSKIGSPDYILHIIEEFTYDKRSHKRERNFNLSPGLQDCRDIIASNLGQQQILYFPTFRRVEEDLHNLGYDEDQLKFNREDTRLIHFGMDDVRRRFHSIETKIGTLLKEGFSKISSEILSQLVKGFSETDRNILNKVDENDINIILARVGDQIPQSDKDKIRKIVSQGEITENDTNLSLFYFLQKLIDIYEKQRELDDSIKVFRDVCNKYLIEKKVFYDESAIRIYIKSDITDNEILLSKLSSGEKQIISIFSKIYLANSDQRFLMLFDEPELSLSIIWQQQLLPDIMNSKKCDFMLAVTHSPFIFDNALDNYAIGLSEYVYRLEPSEPTA